MIPTKYAVIKAVEASSGEGLNISWLCSSDGSGNLYSFHLTNTQQRAWFFWDKERATYVMESMADPHLSIVSVATIN